MKSMQLLIPLVALAMSCADKLPATIELQAPTVITSSNKNASISAVVRNKKGEQLGAADAPLSLNIESQDVAVLVNNNTELRCVKTGTASVVAKSGSVEQKVSVRCLIIKKVDLPDPGRLLVGTKWNLSLHVKDDTDAVVQSPPCSVTSSAPNILEVTSSAELTPRAVGNASVTAACGDASAKVDVAVADRLTSKSFVLKDGERLEVEITKAGIFEATVDTKGDPLALSWVGGECGSSAETLHSTLRCKITSAGKFQVLNPAIERQEGLVGGLLGAVFGSSKDPNAGTSDGIVNILEIPE